MADETGERRVSDAVAIATLSAQMTNMAAAMIRVEAGQSQLLQRLEAAEQRSAENCRTCTTWERLTVLERLTSLHEAKLDTIKDHETRLRVIEPRMAAAAALFSALAFIAGKVF